MAMMITITMLITVTMTITIYLHLVVYWEIVIGKNIVLLYLTLRKKEKKRIMFGIANINHVALRRGQQLSMAS